MSKAAKFWDRMAKNYAKKPIEDEAAYRHKLDVTQSYLKPEFELFEFGCGTGGTARKHAPFVKSILATDVSAKMLEIAKERNRESDTQNLQFQRLDIEQDDIGSDRFDMVLGLSIIHLLGDRALVFRKIFDVLRPGGLFVSSSVCMGRGKWFLRTILPIGARLGVLPSVGFFSDQTLQGELEKAGFVIEYHYRPRPDAAVFLVARKPED